MYVIVRSDLPGAHLTVQAIHAAILACNEAGIKPDTNLVVCRVQDQRELEQWRDKLWKAGIKVWAYHEPDRHHEMTAIATAPLVGAERRPLRNLKLLE